jgi:hypothetical protein
MVQKLDLLKTRNNWQAGFEGATPALRGNSLSDVTWSCAPVKVTGGHRNSALCRHRLQISFRSQVD